MKRIFVVHGWSGSSEDNWMPWIKTKLQEKGFQVFVPEMPDTDTPVIDKWVSHLSDTVGIPDSETYFIGHSIGCQTILRYLEKINIKVGGTLFVAGWFTLQNLEGDEEKAIAKPWIETPIDFEKIKLVLPKSILIVSEDDPYVSFKESAEKFGQIIDQVIVLPNAGHITNIEQPEILDQFLAMVQ